MTDNNRQPRGIAVFGILIVLSSLFHIQTLIFNYGWYHSNFSYMPEKMIWLRYSFSWFQRIAGLTAGFGILNFSNPCRLLGIGIGCFTISTLYWKHPFEAFQTHARYLDQVMGGSMQWLAATGVSFKSLTLPSLIIHDLLDIIFWVWFIYYFTRPQIRAYFLKN